MSSIAIITARGGSKRIPRKNIKEFCGRPIIEYSIKAAIESGIFDEVMVSTDDAEIAEIAVKAGASVPFMRSEETSNDYATTAEVLREVFTKYNDIGKEFDYACCIYPTAPFVTADKLVKAYNLMINNKCDGVTPVVKYSFPPQRCYIIDNSDNIEKLEYKYPEYRLSRSQDLEPYYHDCGQFYMKDVSSFLNRSEEEKVIMPLIMPEMEVQDIDNEEDWMLAEIKYKYMKKNNG